MRILVIRRDNIGDLVCTTPLLAALRERYPQARIEALVNSYNAGVLDGNPHVDAVHSYTKLKHRAPGESRIGILAGRLRMLARLRRESFDYIVLAKAGFDRQGLRFARQLRRRHIVGFSSGSEPGARFITIKVPAEPYADLHEVQVLALLAGAIGVPGAEGPLWIFPADRSVQAWRERLPAVSSGGRTWVAVHISARVREQQWPLDNWAAVIAELTATGVGAMIVWAPGSAADPRHPGDDEKAARLIASLGENTLVVPARTATLEDLIAVLTLCRAFVGADGGAMHVAAALRLPVLALFEKKKSRWHPWRVPQELIASQTGDVSTISPAQVMEAWRRLASRIA